MEKQKAVLGAKVLVHGRHSGIVRYIPTEKGGLIGIELTRPHGNTDGTLNGNSLFKCNENYGIFVKLQNIQSFSPDAVAACRIQNIWRKYKAIRQFKALMHSVTWNTLDNNEEQLNLRRAERIKSAERALAMLAKKKKEKSIKSDKANTIKADISTSYKGAHLIFPLKLENIINMMETFKQGEILHYKFVLEVLEKAKKFLGILPALQEIIITDKDKLTIVGDLHGQLQDLFSIFTINGLPSINNKYLFNGDFVDRGTMGTEVVITLFCFKLLHPESIFLNRGNHESRNQNSWMGFEDEIWNKYDGSASGEPGRATQIFDDFQECFDNLPLCAVIQNKIFVVHGGLFSRDNVTLAHLKGISRKREPPLYQQGYEDRLFEELLWSDPRNINGRQASERGAGCEFGVDVTNNFCAINRMALIIRSHECVPEGYKILHGGRLITLFSASRYCGTQMNKGAFLTLKIDLQPEIQQFFAHSLQKTLLNCDIHLINNVTTSEIENIENLNTLQEANIKMIIERICDNRNSLYFYYNKQDENKNGKITRKTWAEGLRAVLGLDIPYLSYQRFLTDLENDHMISYPKFLSRYRIENDLMNHTGWQEKVILNICKKLYKAIGNGNLNHAFEIFDTDHNGTIEYDEFMNVLKKLDIGLSDYQIFELMHTADKNDDGRIDFNEFTERFQVIFTDIHKQFLNINNNHLNNNNSNDNNNNKNNIGLKKIRRTDSLNPHPAENIDPEVMIYLKQIGHLLFMSDKSLIDIFNHFDINQDGVLQENEFYNALDSLGIEFNNNNNNNLDNTNNFKKRLLKAIDIDNTNTIDYYEFVEAFNITDKKLDNNNNNNNNMDNNNNNNNELNNNEMTWQESILQEMSNIFYQHRIHIKSAFRLFDKDNSGTITSDEFRTGIQAFNSLLDSPMTDDQIEELLNHLDKNKDGSLCYKEFLKGFELVEIYPYKEKI